MSPLQLLPSEQSAMLARVEQHLLVPLRLPLLSSSQPCLASTMATQSARLLGQRLMPAFKAQCQSNTFCPMELFTTTSILRPSRLASSTLCRRETSRSGHQSIPMGPTDCARRFCRAVGNRVDEQRGQSTRTRLKRSTHTSVTGIGRSRTNGPKTKSTTWHRRSLTLRIWTATPCAARSLTIPILIRSICPGFSQLKTTMLQKFHHLVVRIESRIDRGLILVVEDY